LAGLAGRIFQRLQLLGGAGEPMIGIVRHLLELGVFRILPEKVQKLLAITHDQWIAETDVELHLRGLVGCADADIARIRLEIDAVRKRVFRSTGTDFGEIESVRLNRSDVIPVCLMKDRLGDQRPVEPCLYVIRNGSFQNRDEVAHIHAHIY